MSGVQSTSAAIVAIIALTVSGVQGKNDFQAMLARVDAAQLGRRLDWVAAQFSKGTNTIERIVADANGDLGYVAQMEHLRFNVPGQAQQSTREYRVTMLFRREAGAWRIIHRQADSQMTKQAPQ